MILLSLVWLCFVIRDLFVYNPLANSIESSQIDIKQLNFINFNAILQCSKLG